jgi:predicted TIM-barrel fold metal-dependent hydrolase
MIVDADTHIIESESMWDLMDPHLQRRRPILVTVPEDTVYGNRNAFWLIDGMPRPKSVGRGAYNSNTPAASAFELRRTDTALGCREITDVAARLRDMDRLGIDVQVVYPTLFLCPHVEDIELQVGLCRAYNQWLANVWAESGGRIRWVVVPPLASPVDVTAEIAFGKANGAAGVLMRGIEEEGFSAADPAFYDLYGQARDQDLAICLHVGLGWTTLQACTGSRFHHAAVIHAFQDIVLKGIPDKFPGLRFGFIEAGSSWLPYAFHRLGRVRKAIRPPLYAGERFLQKEATESADMMRQANLYVASMADEDLEYLFRCASPENLVIGSDYGHVDSSFEATITAALRGREDLDREVVEALLSKNPMALYGIQELDLIGSVALGRPARVTSPM